MSRKSRISLSLLVFIVIIAHEYWLWYLFPRVNFAAVFLLPVILFISSVVAAITYIVLKKPGKVRKIVLLLVIVGVAIFQIDIHPSADSPMEEISKYWDAFNKYPDDIMYEHLISGNRQEIVAAMVEYEAELPDRVFIIIYQDDLDGPKDYYYIEYRDNVRSYDTGSLQLIENGGITRVILNPKSDEIREGELRIGSGQELVSFHSLTIHGFDEGVVTYYWRKFELETGAEKLFSKILSVLK